VRIPCDVTTDEAERSNLVVVWRKDGSPLKPDGRKTIVDPTDFSLTLKGCLVADTAAYSCFANNSLDTATSDVVRLVVRGTVWLASMPYHGLYTTVSLISPGTWRLRGI
jgi:hypothetical protein